MDETNEHVVRLLLASAERVAEGLIAHHERIAARIERNEVQVSYDGTITGDLELENEFRLYHVLSLQRQAILKILETEDRSDVIEVLSRVPTDYAGLERPDPHAEPAETLATWNHKNVVRWHQVVQNVEQVRKMLALKPVPVPQMPA